MALNRQILKIAFLLISIFPAKTGLSTLENNHIEANVKITAYFNENYVSVHDRTRFLQRT